MTMQMNFFDSVIEYCEGFVLGIEEIVALLKTLVGSFVYFVSWIPQITNFLHTQLITFVPTPLVTVCLVSMAIFVIKLLVGGDT